MKILKNPRSEIKATVADPKMAGEPGVKGLEDPDPITLLERGGGPVLGPQRQPARQAPHHKSGSGGTCHREQEVSKAPLKEGKT